MRSLALACCGIGERLLQAANPSLRAFLAMTSKKLPFLKNLGSDFSVLDLSLEYHPGGGFRDVLQNATVLQES
jgi:hypothetical protein